MTKQEILEGNKIIAVFMNASTFHEPRVEYKISPEPGNNLLYHQDDLGYHSSWDWLMPVLRKIRDYLQSMANRPSRNHCCKGDAIEVDIQCAMMSIDIEKTFSFTVDFIKWYNQKQDK